MRRLLPLCGAWSWRWCYIRHWITPARRACPPGAPHVVDLHRRPFLATLATRHFDFDTAGHVTTSKTENAGPSHLCEDPAARRSTCSCVVLAGLCSSHMRPDDATFATRARCLNGAIQAHHHHYPGNKPDTAAVVTMRNGLPALLARNRGSTHGAALISVAVRVFLILSHNTHLTLLSAVPTQSAPR